MTKLRTASPRVIAIFRMGHIGDTIVALPALWTVRKRFPDAKILYLTQEHDPQRLVQGTDVLRPGIVYDDKLSYTLGAGGVSVGAILSTLWRLRRAKVDTLVYIPSARSASQLKRDRLFFRLAGIKNIVGMESYRNVVQYPPGKPLPTMPQVADVLLAHLSADGVQSSEPAAKLMDLGLTNEERGFAASWLAGKGFDPGEVIVGIGPGSKMPSKLWPKDRFLEVARQLQNVYGCAFILFGSKEEHEVCQEIAGSLNRAVNAAGLFTVRESASIFEHCKLYLGNDTGTMHIAASAGVPCVAVFSARDWPGRWYPYGQGHVVHRIPVSCEGCMLEVCDKANLCLTSISVDEVLVSARQILDRRLTPNP